MFAANAFSLLGLRQLYFLIDGLLDRLVYLAYGLAVILGFIGAKLVIHALHTNELPFINGGEHVTRDAGDLDRALARRDRGDPAGDHGGQPRQGPAGRAVAPPPSARRTSRAGRRSAIAADPEVNPWNCPSGSRSRRSWDSPSCCSPTWPSSPAARTSRRSRRRRSGSPSTWPGAALRLGRCGRDGAEFAGQFFAGWLTEYSLSVDNLFVFVIIMARFAVPRKYQQEVLMVGIVIALVLRGVFILLGAALIEQFIWVFYIFGAFLLYTAINLVRHGGEEDDDEENAVIRLDAQGAADHRRLRRQPRSARARTAGRLFTPMIVVFIAIGTTDLVFALDSIPAIFGLTQEPFIVFTANVFALMGLRQLYFLLGGLLDRLVYL